MSMDISWTTTKEDSYWTTHVSFKVRSRSPLALDGSKLERALKEALWKSQASKDGEEDAR